jgi:hypothetical protein
MPGKVELLGSGVVTTILLNGDTAGGDFGGNGAAGSLHVVSALGTTVVGIEASGKVAVGASGFAGSVTVLDGAGSQRVGLDAAAGSVWVMSASGAELLKFDSTYAALYVGGTGNEGDVVVRDEANRERIKLDAGEGDIWIRSETGAELLKFDSTYAALYVGGKGNEGDVVVRDEHNRERIKLDAGEGDIWVRNEKGSDLLMFDSTYAALYVGGKGNEGDVIVRDEANRERIKLDAGEGDIWVKSAAGTELLKFDSTHAALYVGGRDNEGDVIVRDADGVETIKLDGGRGDIILANADCAEEFDLAPHELASPGTVLVIDDDERLAVSEVAYDRRVAGVVSGAGAYRPGIVLDRRRDGPRRPAVALMGKVYCQVTADDGPIRVGDLLVSSATPGHAMAAADPTRTPGAVLGKALRGLPAGRGLIPILVSLQ